MTGPKRASPRVWLTLPEVIARVRLSRSTILRNQAAGKFPHAVKISDKRVCWDADAIDDYMTCRSEGRLWSAASRSVSK